MNIENYHLIDSICKQSNTTLIAVSKTHPIETIKEAFEIGIRHFGENRVQELTSKAEHLPKDLHWHLIGHLQSNKVKFIAPFVYMIHSVDSLKLLVEINKEAKKNNRIIKCLLQIYIASEETKFGLDKNELIEILSCDEFKTLKNICIEGLMGMATNTDNIDQITNEFKSLKLLFEECKHIYTTSNIEWKHISMGMTSDYKIAIDCGSTMVRIGSALFGKR
jgi:pyridoxal phosphate enzyme (YggS family)